MSTRVTESHSTNTLVSTKEGLAAVKPAGSSLTSARETSFVPENHAIRVELQWSRASGGREPSPFFLRAEGIQSYAMLARTPKTFIVRYCDVPTFRTDILAIGMGIHRHEVVESNTIRAADDHGLSPQAGVFNLVRVILHPESSR